MNVALKRMTAEEYLAWSGQQTAGRFELVNGQVVAMNPQRIEHVETKYAVYAALKQALRGGPCHVVGDGMGVKVGEDTVYEPDALVYCGERLARGTMVMPEPVVVVDVLSPGTKTVDTTRKLEGYFKLASVRHYLIVDPDERAIVHHARDARGAISTSVLTTGEIALNAVGALVPVADCFPA
jgi:Uma2 family endonuclease